MGNLLVFCRWLCYTEAAAERRLDTAHEAGGLALDPERGERMPITLTFHLFGLTFTLRIKK